MSSKIPNDPKLIEFINKEYNPGQLKGMAQAAYELKRDVLRLHELPMTADSMMEIVNAERSFRKAIVSALSEWIDKNCNTCPMGFERKDCKAKQCPVGTIDKILTDLLEQLEQVLPGGIN